MKDYSEIQSEKLLHNYFKSPAVVSTIIGDGIRLKKSHTNSCCSQQGDIEQITNQLSSDANTLNSKKKTTITFSISNIICMIIVFLLLFIIVLGIFCKFKYSS